VIDAGIHGNAIQPGGQLGILAEAVQRPVDLDEDLLGDVLGVVVVPSKLIGYSIDHRTMPLDEQLKGGRVAARSAGNEIRISHSGPVHDV